MKIFKPVIGLVCALCIIPSFGDVGVQQDRELFEFPIPTKSVTVVTEMPKVAEIIKPVEKKEEGVTTETKDEKEIEETPAALVADAETLIKDKLVQKYQVRLDEVIGRMTGRLSTISVDEQRVALTDLRDRMSEKKTLVIEKKNLEPLKRDILLAILDHVIFRLEGLIKQSAQTVTDKVQA